MGKQSNQGPVPGRSAKEQAAIARAAAQSAEKRRQRMVNLTIALVIGVVVLGIIGGALYVSNQTKQDSGAIADPNAAVPEGAFPSGDELEYGIPFGSKPDAVVVQVWEDLQCPACQKFEEAAGQALQTRATNGEILLVTRITTFLDNNLATDHSRRAAAAYGCAVDAGKGMEYKALVFANQPADEGAGWTDDQLISFAGEAGITGDAAATFEKCFTERTYLPWATNSTNTFYSGEHGGTPTTIVDGQEVPPADVADPAKLQALIDAAAAK